MRGFPEPFKSHRSKKGYRGLIHTVLGSNFVIKRKHRFETRSHKKKPLEEV